MPDVRLVISFVGAVLVLALVGIVLLALQAAAVPDVLQNIAVGALTGLVGLLVPARGTPASPSDGAHRADTEQQG